MTPGGPDDKQPKPADIITPKKKSQYVDMGPYMNGPLEPEFLSKRFTHAPEKPKEQPACKVKAIRKDISTAERKARQFTEVGRCKEQLRTNKNILKLLIDDQKLSKDVIQKKCARIDALTKGLAAVSDQLKQLQQDCQKLPSKEQLASAKKERDQAKDEYLQSVEAM